MKKGKDSIYGRYVKRILDVVLSLLALIILSPVLMIVAVLVRIKLGSPVIFKQKRPGKDEKIFTLYKFRTMTNEKDENGQLLSDEIRLTRFGKMLRSTSLDELPELWNILKGDMSIIGPRPLIVQYIPFYNEEEKHRHDMRPGLSGMAQVNGRNRSTWEEKFSYDLQYICTCSFVLDCHVVLQTIKKTVGKADVLIGDELEIEDFDVVRKKEIEQKRIKHE